MEFQRNCWQNVRSKAFHFRLVACAWLLKWKENRIRRDGQVKRGILSPPPRLPPPPRIPILFLYAKGVSESLLSRGLGSDNFVEMHLIIIIYAIPFKIHLLLKEQRASLPLRQFSFKWGETCDSLVLVGMEAFLGRSRVLCGGRCGDMTFK